MVHVRGITMISNITKRQKLQVNAYETDQEAEELSKFPPFVKQNKNGEKLCPASSWITY